MKSHLNINNCFYTLLQIMTKLCTMLRAPATLYIFNSSIKQQIKFPSFFLQTNQLFFTIVYKTLRDIINSTESNEKLTIRLTSFVVNFYAKATFSRIAECHWSCTSKENYKRPHVEQRYTRVTRTDGLHTIKTIYTTAAA